MEKSDDGVDRVDATASGDLPTDVYTKRVPLDMYTKFLSHCRELEFEQAIALSKVILRIDPSDRIMQQYIPVLNAHIELQEDDDSDDEDDDDDDNDDDDDDDEGEDDDNAYEGKEKADSLESKEGEQAGASKTSSRK